MSIPIKTNQLEVDLNLSQFDQKFDVFKITTSEKYFNRGAYMLDTPLLCNNVQSVFFETGNNYFVLMLKDTANKSRLKSALLNTDGGEKITIAQVGTEGVEQRVVVSLLLNAIGSFELDFLRLNNLTGRLYCFHPKWIKKTTKGKETRVQKIPCLNVSISKDLRLSLAVSTFSSVALRKKIAFTKRKFEQYPQYILSANNTLRRKLRDDTGECFIIRQTKGDKTEIPFLDIQNTERFEASKMGVLTEVIQKFNKKYSGVCSLRFKEISDYSSLECSKSLISKNNKIVREYLESTDIKIVDLIGDDYSKAFCKDIALTLTEKYGVGACIGKRIVKNSLNLCVIHNELYYEGRNDPHNRDYSGAAVQHITLEDFMGHADAAISTVVHELLIKNDVLKRQLTLYDWESTGIKNRVSFGVRTVIDDVERYFFMTINPDGTFAFEEKELDLFSSNEYSECVNIFSDDADVVGIIKYEDGCINVISDTSWFTIPEIESIYSLLKSGNTYLRGKEKRTELLTAVTDIRTFVQGKSSYYFVGIIGEGMRTNIIHASNIRRVDSYKESELRFEEMLQLMSVPFVRNGQLTVIPFPFKYLREYIAFLTL